MAVQIAKRLLTVEEYYRMAEAGILTEEDRVELIQGEIIKMSPIKSEHSGHVSRLNALFSKLLGDRAIISVQNPVRIDDSSEPEPDIAILQYRADFYTKQHPRPENVLLLIEVAYTSEDYDREVKLPLYANAGVPEYWIVLVKESRIEAYHSPTRDAYRNKVIVSKGDALYFNAFDLTIQVSDILG